MRDAGLDVSDEYAPIYIDDVAKMRRQDPEALEHRAYLVRDLRDGDRVTVSHVAVLALSITDFVGLLSALARWPGTGAPRQVTLREWSSQRVWPLTDLSMALECQQEFLKQKARFQSAAGRRSVKNPGPKPKMAGDALTQAAERWLREDGGSVADIAREAGVSTDTINRNMRGLFGCARPAAHAKIIKGEIIPAVELDRIRKLGQRRENGRRTKSLVPPRK
ncbi:hypothetical protein [Nitrospirillum amazonense]|uniref:hypothetical protein n=1 Tax=Nitrospirillum amazonense TaxID=28077 RepID=UPI002412CC80|nr:hypothetical protein [Nitrospirillum amazonense]MDG3444625.1 hypothetical protein [Nitrospirillum amazonense]